MTVLHNPFNYGGVVKDSRLFVGRRREVVEICEAIQASASVSVVGERRVGKSSLLLYIADPIVAERNGLKPTKYVFTYFDFLGYPTITPTELWKRLLAESLGQPIISPLADRVKTLLVQDTIELADLEQLFKRFKDAELNLVILFDEFDTAAKNPNFDWAFFGGLRNLSKYSLSYIVASHRTLSELSFAHPEALESPFFNIFRRVTLRGFRPDEVKILLTDSLKDTNIIFNERDREKLYFLAASHPFFLQMASYFLFNAYRFDYRRGDLVDYRWVEDRMRDNTVEHFRYYWDGSQVGEKLILAALSRLDSEKLEGCQPYPAENDPMLRRLIERVLVVEDRQGKPRIFSTLFKQWILEMPEGQDLIADIREKSKFPENDRGFEEDVHFARPAPAVEPEPMQELFISYAWGGKSEEIVDELGEAFQSKDITIVRDKRDLGFKGRIKEFMARLGRGKGVIVVISKKYLESENCMFELVEIAKNGEFYDRIFPVVLADAKIYKPKDRIKYIQFWEQQIRELDEAIKTVRSDNLQGLREDIDLYVKIRETIAGLTDILRDMNALTPELHHKSGFAALIEAIECKMAE